MGTHLELGRLLPPRRQPERHRKIPEPTDAGYRSIGVWNRFRETPVLFALISVSRLDCPTDSGDSSFLALANVRRPRALDELQQLKRTGSPLRSATTSRSPTAMIGRPPLPGARSSKALWSHRTRTRSLVGPNGRTKTSYLVRSTPTPPLPSS